MSVSFGTHMRYAAGLPLKGQVPGLFGHLSGVRPGVIRQSCRFCNPQRRSGDGFHRFRAPSRRLQHQLLGQLPVNGTGEACFRRRKAENGPVRPLSGLSGCLPAPETFPASLRRCTGLCSGIRTAAGLDQVLDIPARAGEASGAACGGWLMQQGDTLRTVLADGIGDESRWLELTRPPRPARLPVRTERRIIAPHIPSRRNLVGEELVPPAFPN